MGSVLDCCFMLIDTPLVARFVGQRVFDFIRCNLLGEDVCASVVFDFGSAVLLVHASAARMNPRDQFSTVFVRNIKLRSPAAGRWCI